MRHGGRKLVGVTAVAVLCTGPVPYAASASEPESSKGASRPVLVTSVQGSESLRAERHGRVFDSVRRALQARGYKVHTAQELLGRAVVACQSPECVAQALDAAEAEFAVVPAIWSESSGGEELTLTLIQRSGRNLNASRPVGADLSAAAAALVDDLLAQRALSAQVSVVAVDVAPKPKRPHAWKAGPIVLIGSGAAAFIAIGVGAAARREDEQLNTSAVAAWSAIGAAAVAGGVAWWVVGAKRRRRAGQAAAFPPTLAVQPARIDLRLRF